MVRDPFMYVLIAILILYVLKIVSLQIVTYAFIGYMIIIFIKSFKKQE